MKRQEKMDERDGKDELSVSALKERDDGGGIEERKEL